MSQSPNIATKQKLNRMLQRLRKRQDCQAEYQQITMAMPAHPWEDIDAEWWITDAPSITEAIEALLELPDEGAAS